MGPDTSPTRLIIADAAGFSGVWREVHFDVWKTPGTAEQIRRRFAGQMQLLSDVGPDRKIVTVAVVSDEATRRLEGDSRAAVDEGVRLTDGRVKASAVVIEARGFKAVIIRSVLAALTLMQKTTHPTKSFDDVEGMFGWVAGFLDRGETNDASGRALSAVDVRAAFTELEAAAAAARQAGTAPAYRD